MNQISNAKIIAVLGDAPLLAECMNQLGDADICSANTARDGLALLDKRQEADVLIVANDDVGKPLLEQCRRQKRNIACIVIDDGLSDESKFQLIDQGVYLFAKAPIVPVEFGLAVLRGCERVRFKRDAQIPHGRPAGDSNSENRKPDAAAGDREPAKKAVGGDAGGLDDNLVIAAHEMRSPLSIMVGYTHALLQTWGESPDESRTMVERINNIGDRLLGKINTFMGLAELESGGGQLQYSNSKLSEILDAVVGDFSGMIESRQLALSMTVKGDDEMYLLDRDKVESVIQNLLSNAIKYTDPGGAITLNCVGDPGRIKFSIEDNGRGMDESQMRHAFDKFAPRADQSVPGSGLGLAIAKSIVSHHGGEIWVESIIGKGSTFSFTIIPKQR